MICEKYSNLSVEERIKIIGSVSHCLQNNDYCFDMALKLIKHGEKSGTLDGVVILPSDKFFSENGEIS